MNWRDQESASFRITARVVALFYATLGLLTFGSWWGTHRAGYTRPVFVLVFAALASGIFRYRGWATQASVFLLGTLIFLVPLAFFNPFDPHERTAWTVVIAGRDLALVLRIAGLVAVEVALVTVVHFLQIAHRT